MAENKLKELIEKYEKIKSKKEELFQYQIEMNLGHKDIENYFKLEANVEWLSKVWGDRRTFQNIDMVVKERGYAQIQDIKTNDLENIINNIEKATSELECVELLQDFKADTQRLLQIIKVCHLIAADTLQQEHTDQLKKIIITKNKKIHDLIFTREGGRTLTCEIICKETNILSI